MMLPPPPSNWGYGGNSPTDPTIPAFIPGWSASSNETEKKPEQWTCKWTKAVNLIILCECQLKQFPDVLPDNALQKHVQ